MGERQQRGIKAAKGDWSDTVLICRKCSKKLRGGFGGRGDISLGKALKELSRQADDGFRKPKRRRSLLVLEIGCQDLCPKQAVVACRPALAHRWFIVPKGTPIGTVAAELGIGIPASEGDAGPVASGTAVRSEPFPPGHS